jgi:hypothetical protein
MRLPCPTRKLFFPPESCFNGGMIHKNTPIVPVFVHTPASVKTVDRIK